MATFKLVNSNKTIIDYISEKAIEEFGASVTPDEENNTITVECADDVVEDILSAYKMAKFKATTGGLVNWGGKKIGTVAGVAKDAGIGGIKVISKGLFGGLKKVAELGIGGTSVIVDEAKSSWSELTKSDEIRSIKKSFGSTGGAGDDIVMVTGEANQEAQAEG